MANTTINLHDDEDGLADAVVLHAPDGDFISLRFGHHVSVFLPGYNRQVITSARQIIATLTQAIATMEQAESSTLKSAGAAIAGEPA